MSSPSDGGDDYVFLPQWATALIVVGVGSLFFVILFGVAVVSLVDSIDVRKFKKYTFCNFQLINRQRRSKKTPTPLTQDMLNELNKDHMGGVDNYGADDFYNLDDTWNDTKPPIKSKVSVFDVEFHSLRFTKFYDSFSGFPTILSMTVIVVMIAGDQWSGNHLHQFQTTIRAVARTIGIISLRLN